MSPLVWDLAHIGWFEELWLLRRGGGEPSLEGFDDLYDAFRHERAERSSLPILKPAEARAYLESVRRQTLEVLEDELLCERPRPAARAAAPGDDAPDAAALRRCVPDAASRRPATGARDRGRARPGRPVQLGTNDRSWAYDNERPAHVVELPAFRIERHPVTNERFVEFVEDGGYRERRYWSDEGWRWLQAAGVGAPLYWERGREGWLRQRFGQLEPVPAGRAGSAHLVLRGRSRRGLGRQAAPDGSGVGESRARCGPRRARISAARRSDPCR